VSSTAVEVSELVKSYGSQRAVAGISFTIARGRLLALLGTNGAGKTTTIEICEGFRRPDAGGVRVLGLDPIADASALRPRVGVMLQDGVGGYTGATAREMLALFASYCAHPLPIQQLIDELGLGEVVGTPVKRLSGGQQQRLSLAMALVGRPELLFLDEPTTGMDPHARRATWEIIRRLKADGVSVVLTTHYLDEAEQLADDVVVLHEGRIAGHGSPAELTRSEGVGTVRFSASPGLAVGELAGALPPGAKVTEERAGHYLIEAEVTPILLAATTGWCAERGVLAEGLTVQRRSLEDVFLTLTSAPNEPARAGEQTADPSKATR
jgi:ABC-2 type transport system ATP-binding protein